MRCGIKAMPVERVRGGMDINVARLPITVGVGGFLVHDGKLLVVRKTYGPWKGLWTLPSGYVEPREPITEAIEREVREETGITGRAGVLVAVRNRVTETANDTFLIFTMAYASGDPRPDHAEVSEAAFVPLSDLTISEDSAPFTRAIIPKVVQAPGLRLDSYAPPKGRMDSLAYLLYV